MKVSYTIPMAITRSTTISISASSFTVVLLCLPPSVFVNMWSIEKFPIDTCLPQHKKPPSRERRRKSSQRESLATPLESINCPLELAGESYRRVWGDYLCSSPMVFQLCLASSAPSLNGFRLLTSALLCHLLLCRFSIDPSCYKGFASYPLTRRRGYVIICADGLKLSCFGVENGRFLPIRAFVQPMCRFGWAARSPQPRIILRSLFLGNFQKKRGRGLGGGEATLNARYNRYG